MASRALTRLVAGAPHRRTRFHDELGTRVSLSRAMRHAPAALATGFLRLAFGYRSVRPWISYDAQARFARFLTTTSRVLEFGSGMSTVWYAERAGEVVSIEDHRPWFDAVAKIIGQRGVGNVRYRFATDRDSYTMPTASERDGGFDLIMVDGSARDACVRNALNLLRPGGILYLDNADKGVNPVKGDIPAARRLMIEAARERGATITCYTDFAPTQLFVQQGMLLQLPG